jgi:hypothetical protein
MEGVALNGNDVQRCGLDPCLNPRGGATTTLEKNMQTKTLMPLIVIAALALPLAAHAQGTLQGAAEGAEAGGRAAGPIGAIVGGTVGAATGTVEGILGVEERPRFREYVVREQRPSYRYRGDVHVGVVLPEAGVTYYEVPSEYRAKGYRYTVVNDRVVLVEPRTRRVIQIVE